MTARLRSALVAACLTVVVLGGVVASTVHVQKYRYRPYLHDSLYLPSGTFLEGASLGYKQLVADLVWFSAIQYYGDYRMDNHGLEYFRGLMDIVTRLDPHFLFAYRFAALVVSQDLDEFEVAIDILKNGMAHNPQSWELPFEIGFLHYAHQRDYNVGARYFDLASKLPRAPEVTRRFAAFAYSKAGDGDTSIRMWEEYADLTDNPFMKELAARYIEKLRANNGTLPPLVPQPTNNDGTY